MKKSFILRSAVLLCSAAAAFECPPPPERTKPEEWVFRKELSVPEADPAPDVSVDPETGKPRRFWLENRISRCFFGPIKRAPLFRDELMDDVDYYPEEYLKRMRREGVNGLWLTVSFSDLVETHLTPRPRDSLRRYAKLRRTVEKCARHGIGIWIFAIEPAAISPTNDLVRLHPDWFGGSAWNRYRMICTSAPAFRRYLEEATYDIFSHAPGLAGMINISHGERATTCLSELRFAKRAAGDAATVSCPRCSKLKPWQVHYNTTSAMIKGMRRADPKARLISWFYEPQKTTLQHPDIYDCARHLPDGVTFQYNFESGSVKIQNGKKRIGGDYWLSEPGPGVPFENVAAASREAGTRLSAKIQAISSHENACVPYVPVPGLLYRKFRAMRELGVKDTMLCWYFGNYPGVMNRAAGLLASSDFSESEEEFLLRLAAGSWDDEAPAIARIWKKLSDAYANYPLTNFMQYYGPFHFGFVFPLYPKVHLRPLSPTWLAHFPPSGDTIGECLDDFTLDEAMELADRMQIDGSDFPRLRARFASNRERLLDLGVMETLRFQFMSARNVFLFYKMRDVAVKAARRRDFGAALAATREMRAIASREREITLAMIPLCEADGRLGFHSEAEAHQFDAARLRWRLGTLDMTDAELDEVDAALVAGKPYPPSETDTGAPTLVLDADGKVDLAPYAGKNPFVLVSTLDETGCRFPVTERVEVAAGRWKPPADAERVCIRPDAPARWPIWPAARWNPRHRLNLFSVEGRNMARIVRPGTAEPSWSLPASLGPGKASVFSGSGKDAEKQLKSFYDRNHRMRFEYVVAPEESRTAEMTDFGNARSARTLIAREIPGYGQRERFLDFRKTAKRTRAGELAHAIAAAPPFMLLACDPAVYYSSDAFDFIKFLPTVYDETRPLGEGVVARRFRDTWYVAAENPSGESVTRRIPLAFLGGKRRMTAFGAERRDRQTDASETLTVTLGPHDGFAARFAPSRTLFFAGDSTLSPRRTWKPNGSWGDALRPYLADDIRIVNCAVGGRSTKSFRSHWDHDLIPYVSPGDWVIIEFGPNDAVKNQPYRSCTPAEYATNLVRYASEVRAKGGFPLFVAPIADRRWKDGRKWQEKTYLQPYIDAMARTAAELGVPYVDMQIPTAEIVREAGPDGSRRLFKCVFDGKDNVHPSKEGARRFAWAFVKTLLSDTGNPANALLRPGAGSAPAPAGLFCGND